MKTSIHTNRIQQFETVLPPEARAEFFRPRTPKIRLAEVPPLPEKPKGKIWHRILKGFLLLILIKFLCVLWFLIPSGRVTQPAPFVETRTLIEPQQTGLMTMPQPTPQPTQPTPSISAAPRAQLISPPITVKMPYGESVVLHFRGILPNQEALPWTGNRIGDAYKIGKDYFVWASALGGPAQWIDP